jgi:bifunctional non-homologous end joining protein LigD
MTTGSRGYHVVVPLQRRSGFDEVRTFARDVGTLAARREPKLFTSEQRKAKRGGRILIDISRNAYAQTSVAPYAVRARPSAPVATPLHWDELSDRRTRADRWTLRTVRRRLQSDGDPWREIDALPVTLTAARRTLDRELAVSPPAPRGA